MLAGLLVGTASGLVGATPGIDGPSGGSCAMEAPVALVAPAARSEGPQAVAQAWIDAESARDAAALADLLDPRFSVATPEGRIQAGAWLDARRRQRWPDRAAFSATVSAVHHLTPPAGATWAAEVVLVERWSDRIGRGWEARSRISIVDGAVVEEARWSPQPCTST